MRGLKLLTVTTVTDDFVSAHLHTMAGNQKAMASSLKKWVKSLAHWKGFCKFAETKRLLANLTTDKMRELINEQDYRR